MVIGTLIMVMSTLLIALWVYAARDMRKQPDVSQPISDACILPITKAEQQGPNSADFDEESNNDTDQQAHTPEDIVKIATTNCG